VYIQKEYVVLFMISSHIRFQVSNLEISLVSDIGQDLKVISDDLVVGFYMHKTLIFLEGTLYYA
jgi:hypothetical protein